MLGAVALVILLQVLSPALGDDCIKAGVTYGFDSEMAFYENIVDVWDCRQKCLLDTRCNGFTFYDGSAHPYPWVCFLFTSNEEEFECEGCESGGKTDCSCGSANLQCVKDENDNLLDVFPSTSEMACKTLCQEFTDCEFYSWFNSSNPIGDECYLFSTCNQVVACSGCSTGPKQCEIKCPDKYMIMDDSTRNVDYNDPNTNYCDWDGSSHSPDWSTAGWYRMMQPAGTQLPEVSPGYQHCGTQAPGWLNSTSHSPILGNQVVGKVCFDYGSSGICYRSTMIDIRSCGGYYIYNFPAVQGCNLRYCSV